MNRDLDILRSLRVPQPDASIVERAHHRAKVAFENREAGARIEPVPTIRSGLLASLAIISVAMVALLALWTPGKGSDAAPLTSQNELLRQLEAEFPDRLVAVIERHGNTDLELAENSSQTSGQGVMVRLHGRNGTVDVLSFSGESVCLNLDGRQICFEMLVTEDGGVILSGANFVWTPSAPVRLAGCRVEATSLGASL